MVLGIDAGSTHYKLVWLREGEVVDRRLLPTEPGMEEKVRKALQDGPETSLVVATGYGRHALVKVGVAMRAVTEIKAQAVGVSRVLLGVATVLDLGGQDFKVIRVNHGRVVGFEMNDRCAAGTGRFLEMAARRLSISLEDMDRLAGTCSEGARLSSMCAVFAESELVSLMAKGVSVERMARGVLDSIAQRLVATVRRMNGLPPIAFTGGGALMGTLVNILSKQIGSEVAVPPEPLFTAALGAALCGEGEA